MWTFYPQNSSKNLNKNNTNEKRKHHEQVIRFFKPSHRLGIR